MAKIKIKYNMNGAATKPSGLTAGELAINIGNKRMFIGDTGENTIELVGLFENTFTGLNNFNAGIYADGGVTLSGNLSGTTATFSRLVTAVQGISARGLSLTGPGGGGRIDGLSFMNCFHSAGGLQVYLSLQPSVRSIVTNSRLFNIGDINQNYDIAGVCGGVLGILNGNESLSQSGLYGYIGYDRFLTDTRNYYLPDATGTFALLQNTQTFTALQSFSSGISAAGGVTLAGTLSGTTAAFSRLVTTSQGISAAGGVTLAGTLSGTTAAFSRLVTASQGISAAGGVTLAGTLSGTTAAFSRLVTFTGGLSAAGGVTLASPNLTGIPTAPTASLGTNTTQIATTAFVLANSSSTNVVKSVNGRTGDISISDGQGISFVNRVGDDWEILPRIDYFYAPDPVSFPNDIAVSQEPYSGITFTLLQDLSDNFPGNDKLLLKADTSRSGVPFSDMMYLTTLTDLKSWINDAGTAPGLVDDGYFLKGITIGGTAAFQKQATFNALTIFNAGISAAGGITLGSPSLTGTPTTPTAAVGTNTTQIATTAFVQNEIIADTVTSFNGRTGAVQGVSAAVAGNGITISGATGAVTITNAGVTRAVAGTGISVNANTGTVTITNSGVLSFNGAVGAVTGASLGANTFTALNTFNSGIKSNIYEPLTGGAGVTIGLLSGGGSGVVHVLSSEMRVGGTGTLQGVTFSTLSGVTMTIRPRHNLVVSAIGNITIQPQVSAVGVGSMPTVLIQNTDDGSGQVRVSGGNLYLGTRYNGVSDLSSNILFANPNNAFTTTLTAPNTASSNKTITLPNSTGTVALDAAANTFTALQSFTAGISAAGGVTLASNLAVNGGNITTTAATGNLFNTTATTLNIGGAATTTNLATVASGLTLNIGTGANGSDIKNIYIGTGPVGGGSARTTIGYAGGAIVSHGNGITLSSSAGGYFVNIPSANTNITGNLNASNALNSTGLLTSTGGLSASGGITFNTPIVSTRMARTSSAVFDTKTANFSPTEADNGKIFVINISGKTQITVTLEGLSTGWRAKFLCLGGGTSFSSTTGNVYGAFGANGDGFQSTTNCVEVHCYASNTYHAS